MKINQKLRWKWIRFSNNVTWVFGRLKGKYLCWDCEKEIQKDMVMEQFIWRMERKDMLCGGCMAMMDDIDEAYEEPENYYEDDNYYENYPYQEEIY